MRGYSADTRKKRALVFLGAIGVALVAWLVLRGGKPEQQQSEQAKPIAVRAITVVRQSIPTVAWGTGTVRPVQEAELAPKIMSTVTAIYVREGDRVRKGQVLAKLEASDLSAQAASAGAAVSTAKSMLEKARTGVELQQAQTRAGIASAEASLQVAKQQLAAVQEGPRKQEKLQAQLALVQAEAQFKNAETENARMKRLYEQGIIPKQRYEGVQTQYEVAKAQVGIARSQAEMSQEGGRSQDVRSAQERVRQAEEAVRLAKAAALQNKMAKREAQASTSMLNQAKAGENAARVQLGYATLVAPFSGVVTSRTVDPGDIVSPGVPVLTVQDDSVYRLEASVADLDFKSVRVGTPVELEIGADGRIGTGVVSVMAPAGDPSTRKFTVKVDVPKSMNPVSGDYGKVGIETGASFGLVLPNSAIHDESGIDNVFVATKDNRTDMRIVRTGRKTSHGTEITTGLRAGDRVVTWSAGPLSDDAPIKVEGN